MSEIKNYYIIIIIINLIVRSTKKLKVNFLKNVWSKIVH